MKEIELTRGKVAIVDDDDYEWLSQLNWWYSANGYAATDYQINKKRTRTYMHHIIIDRPRGMQVDHINRDKLDNRKCNLRLVSPLQNSMNQSMRGGTSKYKGVYEHRAGKWVSRIKLHRKQIYLGIFTDETEAAKAYDKKAKELFGEYACLNFPEA